MCNFCGCQQNPECGNKVTPQDIVELKLIKGLSEEGCHKFERPAEMLCRLLNALETGAPLQVGDFVVGRDCRTHQITPELARLLISVADTASVDMTYNPTTGVISAEVNPQWVRGLFCAEDTTYVNMSYNVLTGCFSATIDPNQITTNGICAALNSLVANGSATYGSTQLAGRDCRTYTIPAQTLSFNPVTRNLTISDGNTVNIPDKYVSGFSIVGQVATILMNDGQIFQQVIPIGVDINVDSFSLAGGVLTITETDGTVHTVTLPQDCCPTSLQVVGNTITLTLSNGVILTAPLPPEISIATMTISGNTLTITQTNGSVFTATLPQYNVVSTDNSIGVTTVITPGLTTFDLSVTPQQDRFISNVTLVGSVLTVTRNDGQSWSVTLPATDCNTIRACFTEGQNIDITNGVVSAGYLRGDGNNCYTWVNQDGLDILTFCIPPITVIDSSTVDLTASGVANHTLTATVRVSAAPNNSITVNPDGLYVPNLCSQIQSLPVGLPVGPGGSVTLVTASCERVTLTTQNFTETPLTVIDTTTVNLTNSGTAGHTLQADVRISTQGGNAIVVNPDGLYVRDFCTSAASLPFNGVISAGQDVAVVGIDCTYYRISIPNETPLTVIDTNTVDLTSSGSFGHTISANVIISPNANNSVVALGNGIFVPNACAQIGTFPVGASIGAGNTVNLVAADCTIRSVTIPAYLDCNNNPIPNNARLVRCPTSFQLLNVNNILIDSTGVGRQMLLALPCTIPTRLIGSNPAGDVLAYEYSGIVDSVVAFNTNPGILNNPYAGSFSLTLPGTNQVLNLGVGFFSINITNPHPCKVMRCVIDLGMQSGIFFAENNTSGVNDNGYVIGEISFDAGLTWQGVVANTSSDAGNFRDNWRMHHWYRTFSIPPGFTQTIRYRERMQIFSGTGWGFLAYEPYIRVFGTT